MDKLFYIESYIAPGAILMRSVTFVSFSELNLSLLQ